MKIILTVDYEVFGNGTGNCEACRINPTKKMVDVASDFQVPLTFFVDYGEIRRKKEEIKRNNHKQTNECIEQTEKQLKGLVRDGHDIQLHLHPQWLTANRDEGSWKVNPELESIARLEEYTSLTFEDLFEEGKEYFESLLQPVDSNYSCFAFRAGAWAIQPASRVIKGLSKAGFEIDSSVVPGMQKNEHHYSIDFSNAPVGKDYWDVVDNICSPADSPLLNEVPIAACKGLGFQRLFVEDILQRFLGSGYAPGCSGSSFNSRSIFERIMQLIKVNAYAVDFCHFRTSKLMKYLRTRRKKGYDYAVLIGHTKEFSSPDSFYNFLQKAHDEKFEFTSFKAIKDEL